MSKGMMDRKWEVPSEHVTLTGEVKEVTLELRKGLDSQPRVSVYPGAMGSH